MGREERCSLAVEKGYTYEPETGQIYGVRGKVITATTNGYIDIRMRHDNKLYNIKGHQLAWYITNNKVVDCIDHINGIKSDNRIENLRSITNQQNHFNRPTAKGYYWRKKLNKWQTQIRINDKLLHIGLFIDEKDARNAYLEAKKIYHIID